MQFLRVSTLSTNRIAPLLFMGRAHTVSTHTVESATGIPEKELKRVVTISKMTRTATQQGQRNINTWILRFPDEHAWKNPLMGWNSTGDSVGHKKIYFSSHEDAIKYCNQHHIEYEVEAPRDMELQNKDYAENFSFHKASKIDPFSD